MLAEVEYEAGQRVHRHAHPHARFVLMLSGGLTEVRGEETHNVGSSTLMFRRAGEPHGYMVSPRGATCLIVDVDAAWYARDLAWIAQPEELTEWNAMAPAAREAWLEKFWNRRAMK